MSVRPTGRLQAASAGLAGPLRDRLLATWPTPETALREALLLLPDLPSSATVLDPFDRWVQPLARWGMTASPADGGRGAPALAVGSNARALARSGADSVLLTGIDPSRRLQRAGYQVLRWRIGRTRLGPQALVPAGSAPLARRLRTGGRRRGARQLAVDAALRLQSAGAVTVASRAAPQPLALRASGQGPDAAAGLLLGTGSARRLPVFLVAGTDGQPISVVKVGAGEATAARFPAEQELLGVLRDHGLGGVPRPLGHGGRPERLLWSAETWVAGRPLTQVLPTAPPAQGLELLAAAAEWLVDLARATTGPQAAGAGLRLHARHGAATGLLSSVAAVPGVLVHGDCEHNVLVDGHRVGVIDWEKARAGGLPLHDLLPLLCKGLVLLRGVDRRDATGFVEGLLHGDSPDAVWLRAQVRGSLSRLGIEVHHGGALAGLALASWASRHLDHDALLVDIGGAASAWRSPAAELAPRWVADPVLGARWPALEAG